MQRRRLAMLAAISLGALALAGCAVSPPSVTTAEPATLPDWVEVPTAVDAGYAVGERDGVTFTALEAETGEWCLAMHRVDDTSQSMVVCGGGPTVSAESSTLASARLEIDGIVGTSDGEAISDWVVVHD